MNKADLVNLLSRRHPDLLHHDVKDAVDFYN